MSGMSHHKGCLLVCGTKVLPAMDTFEALVFKVTDQTMQGLPKSMQPCHG